MLGIYYTQLIASVFQGALLYMGMRERRYNTTRKFHINIPVSKSCLSILAWTTSRLALNPFMWDQVGGVVYNLQTSDLLGVVRGPKIYIMRNAFICVTFHF